MSSERPPTQAPEPDPRERALARTIGQSDLLARVLLARGLDDPDRARQHMRPDLSTLADPFAFRQMERSVERVRRAIRDGERIFVHGDYDVDGVTGTVLLLKFFSLMGVVARPIIPDRRQVRHEGSPHGDPPLRSGLRGDSCGREARKGR